MNFVAPNESATDSKITAPAKMMSARDASKPKAF